MVKLSNNHGYLNDCGNVSQTFGGFTEDWSDASHEHEDGNTATLTVDSKQYFKINVTNSVGNKSVYYEYPDSGGANNLSVSQSTYKYIRFRYKTSDASIKAKIVLVFSDANTQTVLAESSSTTFTHTTVEITSGKTVDHIRIYATQATGDVYYDFLLIYEGDFTIPNVAFGMDLDLPVREAILEPPNRDTSITQNLGSKSAELRLSCDLTQGTWTRAADTIDGQVFIDIWHNRNSEPWQWLNTEVGHQFKVTVQSHFYWRPEGNKTVRVIDIVLREYSLGSKSGDTTETYIERLGIT